jgi:hypothetical protein
MGSLDSYADELGRHGLMIPPFSNISVLGELIEILRQAPANMDEKLTVVLSGVRPDHIEGHHGASEHARLEEKSHPKQR